MNRDVLLISFSAFFADLGYQAIHALFPIFLVITLSTPASAFGLANAIAYGIGSFFGYLGGIVSDRYSDKKVAVLGNLFIPLMSLTGLTVSPTVAIALFAGGWWARNFRTPPRRSLLVGSTTEQNRGRVFGFLHALDIGGGMFSVAMLLLLVAAGVAFRSILLLTVIPLAISTLLLLPAKDIRRNGKKAKPEPVRSKKGRINRSTFRGILLSTALFGFSYYSLGFPILTIAQKSTNLLGIASYGVYLGVSAITGYWIGSKRLNYVKGLSILGYSLSGIGTAILALGYLYSSSVAILYVGVAILGFALGVIETFEPTIVSFVKGVRELGKGMGALTASRSIGIFMGNLIMGVLYVLSPFYSYSYAAIISVAAGMIMYRMGSGFNAIGNKR
ncbi:MAG: MFS transporter [Candidatus Micrarchaeales archaeon]|nr:MFS transporter [Candidatus Micrarchaeales archaeon]